MTGNSTSVERGSSASAERGGGSERVSRRGFIRATGATAAGVATATAGEASAQAQTYRFGGEVQGWRGRAPSAIEGETNPTIQLQAGQEYEVVWENLDGAPHDFTIQNSNGTILEQTEQISEQGATASLTFTATAEMAQYICTVHPSTMVGSIEVSGGTAGGGQAGGEGGGGLPLWAMLMVGAVVLAFLSPLLFALFLFSRGRENRERPAGRRSD